MVKYLTSLTCDHLAGTSLDMGSNPADGKINVKPQVELMTGFLVSTERQMRLALKEKMAALVFILKVHFLLISCHINKRFADVYVIFFVFPTVLCYLILRYLVAWWVSKFGI